MASSSNLSCSNQTNPKQRKHFPIERRPKMLKDFLVEDSYSCSSTGFKSFPRRPREDPSIEIDLASRNNGKNQKPNNAERLPTRSRSNAIQAVINAVKSIHFAAVKSTPSILPRSLSRRLSKKNFLPRTDSENKESQVKVTVKIRDILRWRSFRDLVDEKFSPLDFASSPHYCTTITTTTTTGSTSNRSTPCSSNCSSWCDSDFTSEFLPLWSGESESEVGKKSLPCVGKGSMEAMTTAPAANTEVGPKDDLPCEEKDQHSPVSVLDFQSEEEDEEESVSSFNQSLANMERTKQKLTQKIRRFETLADVDPINLEEMMSMEENTSFQEGGGEIEEKAMQLLNQVRATCSIGSCKDDAVEQLLLDFFTDELTTKRNHQSVNDDQFDQMEMISLAEDWISGENSSAIEWGVEHKNREAYVRDMDKGGKWNKFEEEKQELALEIENGILGVLVDEVLVDLYL